MRWCIRSAPAERPAAVQIATALRAQGLAVELVLGQPRLKRVLSDADKAGTRRSLSGGSR